MPVAHKIPVFSQEKIVPLSEPVRQAIASLALEGISLPEDSLKDIALLDSGHMSKEEFYRKTIEMAKK